MRVRLSPLPTLPVACARPPAPAHAALRRLILLSAGVLALCLGACSERRAEPVEPGRGTIFSIRWRGALTGNSSDAYARIESAHVTVAQGSAILLDTVAPFAGRGDTGLELAVRLQDPAGTVGVTVELLAGSQVLFRGGGSAELRRGATASMSITVAPVVAGVSAPTSVTLTALGDSVRLKGAAIFATGDTVTGVPVSWSGDGRGIIGVSADGLLTALQEGQAQATASYQGFTHVTAVLVQAAVASLALSVDTFSLYVDSVRTLSAVARDRNGNALARTVRWSSSRTAVAIVDGSGSVRAVGPGMATITAATDGGSADALVTVRRVPVGAVQVTPASASVTVGRTVQLSARTQDITGKVVTDRGISWSTDAAAVATVDSTGLVRALAAGKATITATSEGRSATAAIQVMQPVLAVSSPPLTFQLRPGGRASAKSVPVINAGAGVLSGLSLAVSYSSRATGWLSASLSATTAPATLTVTVDPGALAVGSYTGTVTLASTTPGAGTVQLGVTLAIEQPRVGVSRSSVLLRTFSGGVGAVSDTVTVLNLGPGTLSGVVANVTYAAGEATGWLALAPAAWGVVTGAGSTLTLTATLSGAESLLPPGSYHASVTFSSNDPAAGAAQVSVVLEVLVPTAADVRYNVLHASARFWNTAIVSVSAGTVSGNTAIVPPGATIRVSGNWQIGPVTDVSYCPDCIIELYVAWIAPAQARGATPGNAGLWMGILNQVNPQPGSAGTFDFATTAPTVPGQYYIGAGETLDYVFQPAATGAYGWVTGGPTANQAVSFRIQVR